MHCRPVLKPDWLRHAQSRTANEPLHVMYTDNERNVCVFYRVFTNATIHIFASALIKFAVLYFHHVQFCSSCSSL